MSSERRVYAALIFVVPSFCNITLDYFLGSLYDIVILL